MRLIDADSFLENHKELADCDFIHPKYEDTLRDLIDRTPTACDIEVIRAEIERNREEWIKGTDPEWSTYDRCLWIIDKHTKGAEE